MYSNDAGGARLDRMGIPQSLNDKLPISVAEYMRLNNSAYYNNRDPFGQKGDFITAPEISQIFGEMIAVFALYVWQKLDKPKTDLIECGPGRGTLMADMLRTMSPHGFCEKASIHLVEQSSALKKIQNDALKNFDCSKSWHNHIQEKELDNDFKILICNEFFDALEIDQYVYQNNKWCKRIIDKHDNGAIFAVDNPTNKIEILDAQESDIYEISPAREIYMQTIVEQLNDNGIAIIIDYGSFEWGMGDTLQAIKDNKKVDALSAFGDVDLSSHVDFSKLTQIAIEKGYYAHPLLTQGQFLNSMGGFLRAQKLGQIDSYERLVSPEHMGELFKVLVVSSHTIKPIIKELLP